MRSPSASARASPRAWCSNPACRRAGTIPSCPGAGTDDNLITTRILWLRGLEPGLNRGGDVDTYERYVYIHGTNHEDRLGERLSAGCVLMRNLDILALYDQVRTTDQVLIVD